jgi:glycolate oxidase iron-sulfur subunit
VDRRVTTRLDVVDDELVACVSCGLCLPHCPTYRVTGEESASPRGRIAAMRAVHFDGAPVDDAFLSFMDACVQCRGCEAACPSGVPFGRLMEGARSATARVPWWQRLGLRLLPRHRLLVALSWVLALLQRVRLVPRRFGLPRIPLRRPALRSSPAPDVWLFTGCVMDAWMPSAHAAVARVLEAAGFAVGVRSGCCGALHTHAGLVAEGHALAERTLSPTTFPGVAPIVVDSAGCGAQLKAADARGRVYDVHEFLALHADRLPAPGARRFEQPVAVQDPCHLRHVQKAHQHVRTVLAPYADVVELDDDGLCCGAGGAYSALHPDKAASIRDRKLASIARSGAPVVVSANPGCAMHLSAAGLDVRHPLEIVDEVISGR